MGKSTSISRLQVAGITGFMIYVCRFPIERRRGFAAAIGRFWEFIGRLSVGCSSVVVQATPAVSAAPSERVADSVV
jgi:hypothetical protein